MTRFLSKQTKGSWDDNEINHKEAIDKASKEFEKHKKQYMNSHASDYDTFLKTVKKLLKK